MYECGCTAAGDNIASFCPIHGQPILRKPNAVLVGFFGAGPLFDDVEERRRERWNDNRRER